VVIQVAVAVAVGHLVMAAVVVMVMGHHQIPDLQVCLGNKVVAVAVIVTSKRTVMPVVLVVLGLYTYHGVNKHKNI
jgi:hypothetical protein